MIIFKIRFLSKKILTNNHFQNYKSSLDCKCVTTINKGSVIKIKITVLIFINLKKSITTRQDQNHCGDLLLHALKNLI